MTTDKTGRVSEVAARVEAGAGAGRRSSVEVCITGPFGAFLSCAGRGFGERPPSPDVRRRGEIAQQLTATPAGNKSSERHQGWDHASDSLCCQSAANDAGEQGGRRERPGEQQQPAPQAAGALEALDSETTPVHEPLTREQTKRFTTLIADHGSRLEAERPASRDEVLVQLVFPKAVASNPVEIGPYCAAAVAAVVTGDVADRSGWHTRAKTVVAQPVDRGIQRPEVRRRQNDATNRCPRFALVAREQRPRPARFRHHVGGSECDHGFTAAQYSLAPQLGRQSLTWPEHHVN